GFCVCVAGVLGKSSGQGVGVAGVEENQVLGRGGAAVLFHRIVHAVLAGDALKVPDRRVVDLDVGDALVLPDELLHRLLALGGDGGIPAALLFQLFLPAVGHVLGYGGLEQPPGELGAADDQRQGSVFYFLLHRSSLPSSVMQKAVLGTKAGPPAAVTGGGPSYRHQDQRPQFRKVQLALGRHQRVGAGVAVAAKILHAEQPLVGALGVGQHAAR